MEENEVEEGLGIFLGGIIKWITELFFKIGNIVGGEV